MRRANKLSRELASFESKAREILRSAGMSENDVAAAAFGWSDALAKFIPDGDEYKPAWYALQAVVAIQGIHAALAEADSPDDAEQIVDLVRLGQDYQQARTGIAFPKMDEFLKSKRGRDSANISHEGDVTAKDRAQELGRDYFEAHPQDRTGDCLTHVQNQLKIENFYGYTEKTLRKWITEIAPPSAKVGGRRPAKRPPIE